MTNGSTGSLFGDHGARRQNRFEISGGVALIHLNGPAARLAGAVTMVDVADADRVVSAANWTLHSTGYAHGAIGGGERALLHRFIMGDALNGLWADHINGDRLDNRRANLRPCTRAENALNKRSYRGTSSFKGVHRHRSGWRARIRVANRLYSLGTHASELDAALAYDIGARVLHGRFASLNVPDIAPPPELAFTVTAWIARRLPRGNGAVGVTP